MGEKSIYYFAYGSNLHPVRLSERTPSAELLGMTDLSHHRLAFHKQGRDGSSKCNVFRTDKESDKVYGAIYQMDSAHKPVLDSFEGNGYRDDQLMVDLHGKKVCCFSYFAQQPFIVNDMKPYHWYKDLVVLGARYLGFPEAYVRSIELTESIEDPDKTREMQCHGLIQRILQSSSS